MADWDEESGSEPEIKTLPVALAKKKWQDEDAEDQVKDEWDASDQEETKQAAGPLPPVRKKGITKQKIAEKEAAELARAERQAELLAEEQDPEAKRRAARERELKADLESARGLFGNDAVNAVEPDDPFQMNPSTKADFEELSRRLSEIIIEKFGSKPLYKLFVEEHVKALCQPLGDIDVRKASSTLATLANEKQKAAKEGTGAKKKKAPKPVLGGARTAARADTNLYDEVLDDDLDFM